MLPMLVFPMHDPDGTMFPHLMRIAPMLKPLFAGAMLGVTPVTAETFPQRVSALAADGFFTLLPIPPGLRVGEQFAYLYRYAAETCPPAQILHLCFIDRLAYALQTEHQRQFVEHMRSLQAEQTPILYCRSQAAWASHPQNYLEIEQFATRVGEFLFEKTLDYAWCHLAICAAQLQKVMTQVKSPGLDLVAEMVLAVKDEINTLDVDWLAWEDPYLLGRDAADLKRERETSPQETRKRLGYIIPMVQALLEHARPGNQ